ncbi:hypothetical protein [Moritella marina]|uniref:hypothetical protein n=1 Tax=Moritella marina TaxID=90736 RepID=UPI003703C0E6
MSRLLVIASFCIFTTGCISPNNFLPWKYQPLNNYRTKGANYTLPTTGTVNVSRLGDMMLEQGYKYTKEVVVLPYTVTFSGIPYGGGMEFDRIGSDSKRIHFIRLDLRKWFYVDRETGFFCENANVDKPQCTSYKVDITKQQLTSNPGTSKTLIYNGKIDNTLNISYREFSGNIARPAFYSDIKYDLDESRIVSYKGATLEIIKANNREIEYKVISNFKS